MIHTIAFLLLLISGISKAICDVSASSFYNSKLNYLNGHYWSKSMSWRYKWKNESPIYGERFWGSSTVFVFLTDAWHLFDVIRDLTLIAACLLIGNVYYLLIIYAVRQIFFELTYRWLMDTLWSSIKVVISDIKNFIILLWAKFKNHYVNDKID